MSKIVEAVGSGKQKKLAKADATAHLLEKLRDLHIVGIGHKLESDLKLKKSPISILNEICQKNELKSPVFVDDVGRFGEFSCTVSVELPPMLLPREVGAAAGASPPATPSPIPASPTAGSAQENLQSPASPVNPGSDREITIIGVDDDISSIMKIKPIYDFDSYLKKM